MTTETIALILVLLILFGLHLRAIWKIASLEYRTLLLIDQMAILQQGPFSPVAAKARQEIARRYSFQSMIAGEGKF